MHFKTGKFTQTDRLRGKSNFALFFRAKQYKGKFLRIAVIPASEDKITGKIYRKVAFAVGKKTASKAVDRNKIKRRLREIYRIHRNLLPDNIWLMIIANSGSKDESYRSMENELKSIFETIAAKNAGDRVG